MKKNNSFSLLRFFSSVVAITSLIVGFSLLYVWQKNQELETGYRVNRLKKQITKTNLLIEQIGTKIQTLKSPEKILARISPDLKITSSKRIVHLSSIERDVTNNVAMTDTKSDNSRLFSKLEKLLRNTTKQQALLIQSK